MEDSAELTQIELTQRDTDFFGQRIADRVRVTEPLALDHFHRALRQSRGHFGLEHELHAAMVNTLARSASDQSVIRPVRTAALTAAVRVLTLSLAKMLLT